MKIKHVTLVISLTVPVLGYSFPDIGRIAFRVAAIEERTGLPLENISVTAVFTDRPTRWGGDSVERVERRMTDAKGMCRFTGTSNHGAASYIVGKTPGYYPTSMVRYESTNKVSNVIPTSYRCEPYDCVYTTLLQRIEHPIPLHVRRVSLYDRENGIGGFDGTNAVLRFDFMADDWLPPHGSGKHADMIIRTEYKFREGVKDGKYRVQPFYDFTNVIEYPGEGNGFVEESFAGLNCGIKIRTAPEACYTPRKTLKFGRSRKKTTVIGIYPQYYTESDMDRCYCFRIRSKFNEKGELVEAYYGKVYGDFNFKGWDDAGFCGIDFVYYLNPKSLDRNLEWDTTKNLCPAPGKLIYKNLTGKPVPES